MCAEIIDLFETTYKKREGEEKDGDHIVKRLYLSSHIVFACLSVCLCLSSLISQSEIFLSIFKKQYKVKFFFLLAQQQQKQQKLPPHKKKLSMNNKIIKKKLTNQYQIDFIYIK